jgi:hypothetical protein
MYRRARDNGTLNKVFHERWSHWQSPQELQMIEKEKKKKELGCCIQDYVS